MDKRNKLKTPILETNSIALNYRDNTFGFRFSANSLSNPKVQKYSYKLENFESEWIEVNSLERYANYPKIPPGEYVFKVRAQNKNGEWSNNIRSIKITITPPWWQTIPAYFVYILLSILLITSFIAYRTKKIRASSRKLEQQVNERTSEINQLLAQKNEEFANVSHEFRTPLTLILGPIKQLLIEDKDNQKLNTIQRNGYRLLRMVDQLLNLETFRIKSITQKSPQAFGETIQLIAQAFRGVAVDKELAFNIKQIDKVYFDFTPDALDKIVLNLLSNAMKYTQKGGEISISAIREPSHYVISIQDTGIGISAENQNKVFERFNRILDDQSEQVTGAGIGLALVKSLVESHQGQIKLESEVNNGTLIQVTLPIINEVSAEQASQSSSNEIIAMEIMGLSKQGVPQENSSDDVQAKDAKDATALIIEDNDDMRQFITESIQHEYRVITANNGEEGVKLALEEVPDLIISDIMMPKMDGYQVTSALRSNFVTNHIPIVLLTARGDRDSRLKGWQQKADDYLTKPFDVEELLLRLKNLLDIRDILKKRFAETAFEPAPLPSSDNNNSDSKQKQQQLEFTDKVNRVLEELHGNQNLSVSQIAQNFAMSDRQFFRKLKNTVDMSPSEYLRRFRLEKAKTLIREGKSSSAVAYEAGFTSQSYFGKCFKAQFGMSPGEFKKQCEIVN